MSLDTAERPMGLLGEEPAPDLSITHSKAVPQDEAPSKKERKDVLPRCEESSPVPVGDGAATRSVNDSRQAILRMSLSRSKDFECMNPSNSRWTVGRMEGALFLFLSLSLSLSRPEGSCRKCSGDIFSIHDANALLEYKHSTA
jgi:hypothetical protein